LFRKKFVAGILIGALAITFPISANAKRLHDPKIDTKNVTEKYFTDEELEQIDAKKIAVWKENQTTLTAEEAEWAFPGENNYSREGYSPATDSIFVVPQTVSVSDDSILGMPIATQKQCVKYLLSNNPNPNLSVSAEEIVAYYYEEAMREGIRPELAFAQALKETGFFRYGGDVVPEQNNYCGLGTTGGGVRGLYFSSPQIGVRAHIQHLLAYTSTRRPTTEIVDPRYSIVRSKYGNNTLAKWYDLNGRWAVPGYHYGQDIMAMFRDILIQ